MGFDGPQPSTCQNEEQLSRSTNVLTVCVFEIGKHKLVLEQLCALKLLSQDAAANGHQRKMQSHVTIRVSVDVGSNELHCLFEEVGQRDRCDF